MRTLSVIIMALIITGCATGPVIGPCTAWNAARNQRALDQRERNVALRSVVGSNATQEKKEKAVQIIALGGSRQEVGVILGVDLLALGTPDSSVKLTGGEKWTHAGLMLLDVAIDAILYENAKPLWEGGDTHSDSGQINRSTSITINGNENAVNLNTGDSADSNADNNGTGTSNNDSDATGN